MKLLFPFVCLLICLNSSAVGQSYRMPGEELLHEGTWLQWPHNDLYGPYYQDDVEDSWVAMAKALQTGEKVHIIAQNESHKSHILSKLNSANVPLSNIDFFIYPTDDVWVRDNGPIFVYDQNNDLTILDWGFNGWGGDTPFAKCDRIPQSVSSDIGVPRLDLSTMVLEGGAIEHDGEGTMIATRSCITHSSRNPELSEQEIENYFSTYLGFEKFIWLDGVYGQDITDHHIDGFVKFANDSTIVTMDSADLAYWLVTPNEIQTIYNATNIHDEPYKFVFVPLTQNNVKTTHGADTKIKGSYCNYYIGNKVVLVPTYGDPNDAIALDIIQAIYPNRNVVGINMQNLYEYGGMVHCITQQQPVALNTSSLERPSSKLVITELFPNPGREKVQTTISLQKSGQVEINVYNSIGQKVGTPFSQKLPPGKQTISIPTEFSAGMYYFHFTIEGHSIETKLVTIQ